ncbi:MAG: GNAT family N-acetyltransferase [Candidatus Hodarchaeales archaeon]|jgi:ribosomal-protein-alanine N-acetyltransferase
MKDFEIKHADKNETSQIMKILELANMHYIPSKEMPELGLKNFLVAKIEGKIVGVCGFKMISKTKGKTTLLAVHPKYRGNGIGSALQIKRMNEMIKRGAVKIITNADNPKTIDWYKKKFGYKEIGKLRKFHEFGVPEIDHWTTLELDIIEWEGKHGEE